MIYSLHHNPKSFWHIFLLKKHNLILISFQDWSTYATRLYYDSNQPLLSIIFQPTSRAFFPPFMIHTTIKKLNSGKALDIDVLQAKYLKHANFTLPFLLSSLFNKVICYGFSTSWTLNIIHPIYKFGDLNEPSNYCTIMIDYTLAKLCASIMEDYIS